MLLRRIARPLVILAVVGVVVAGGQAAEGQDLRVEVGGGWAIPSSSVDMPVRVEGGNGGEGTLSVDPGWGPNGYAAAGLEWTLSSNFSLAGLVRAQQSWMRGDREEYNCPDCSISNEPDGRLRVASLEGRITLTSTGRIQPYFLVGLGVVHTTVTGAEITDTNGNVIQVSDVEVTDAGGDVGFGAYLQIVEDLSLTGEMRATGSLPGAKENAVTTFPFSLGLSYAF